MGQGRFLHTLAAIIFMSPLAVAAAETGGAKPDAPARPRIEATVEVLTGDRTKPGLYILRSTLKAGGIVDPHTHPDARYITVLSGALYVCNSTKISAETTTMHKAGAFFTIPPNTIHCSWAKDGDTVYTETGVGPSSTSFDVK
jgi:quercetin dioxygenase-like cupin family protein